LKFRNQDVDHRGGLCRAGDQYIVCANTNENDCRINIFNGPVPNTPHQVLCAIAADTNFRCAKRLKMLLPGVKASIAPLIC